MAAALAAVGCGSDSNVAPVGQPLAGSVSQLVQCSDWNDASVPEKLTTIEDIRSHVNQEDSGVTASELTDEEALDVFDHGCARPASDSFRLNVMYARAAAFKPLQEVAEGAAN